VIDPVVSSETPMALLADRLFARRPIVLVHGFSETSTAGAQRHILGICAALGHFAAMFRRGDGDVARYQPTGQRHGTHSEKSGHVTGLACDRCFGVV